MASLQRFVPATCPMKFNKLNFVRRVAGTKYPPNWCCTSKKSISLHEGTCRCNISLRHVPATFSCVCKCCNFVPATCPRYTSLLHVASVCTTQVFCRCNMSLQHVAATCPCNMTPRVWPPLILSLLTFRVFQSPAIFNLTLSRQRCLTNEPLSS